MTYKEAVIISAYTGEPMCEFCDMHKYIKRILNRPILTHEYGLSELWEEIKEKVRPDFEAIVESIAKE